MSEQTYGGVSQTTGATGTGAAAVVKDEVQRLAADAREETSRAVSQAREQASQLAARATEQTTQRLDSLATALRQAAQQLETDDAAGFGRYAVIAADQVEKVSGYLGGKDLGQLVRDTQTFARRHPDLFLGGAFVAGVMLARFIKSSAPETGSTSSGGYEPFNPSRISGFDDYDGQRTGADSSTGGM